MGQRAPSGLQIAVAVAFAFSCFGLLLFLWSAFGGPVPFGPEGYRVKVPVSEAAQLAEESDVRISNVSVGKVKDIELGEEGDERDLAIATLEIDAAYAPIPSDTRAILRAKTLLGETYVELTPGDPEGGTLAEDATLPTAQVGESVQLDEIFRTFDERTRVAFQNWMQQGAIATAGRGADLNAAIGNLQPFAEDANRLLRVLDTQEEAVGQLVKNTGVVFDALSERRGQLQGLIRNSGTVFATTAERDEELKQAFIALPTFLDESRLTVDRLAEFSQNADPLVTQLHPSARRLSVTLRQVARLSPELAGFFAGARKLAKRSKAGLPALRRILDSDLPPLLDQLHPFTRNLTPLIQGVGRYQREIAAFLGNAAAATNASGTGPETGRPTHYLRTEPILQPDAFAVYQANRLQVNRSNPYVEPGGALKVPSMDSFETGACDGPPGVVVNLNEGATVGDPAFDARATKPAPYLDPAQLFQQIRLLGFAGNDGTGGAFPAPACRVQGDQAAIGAIPPLEPASSRYLHTYPLAP